MNPKLEKLVKYLTITQSKQIPLLEEEYPDLYDQAGLIQLESDSAQFFLKNWESPKAFDKIGYARSLGGFFYQFFYALLGAAILAGVYIPFLSFFYPWPELKSMADFSKILFLMINTLFDIPTSYAIERFIGEWRIKDTRKMMEYVRFYMWYQMATGLILVSVLGTYTITALSEGDLVWAKWLILLTLMKQYPSNQTAIISTIKGLQRFDVETYYYFWRDTVLRPIFEYAFVLMGQFVLGKDPRIGPLFGIAIGFALGSYFMDFFSMILSLFLLRKAIKPLGFTLLDVLIPKFGRDVIISSVKFGLIVSIPSLISSVWVTMTTLWWYDMVPAYLTLKALSALADELANLIKRGGGINVKATISEAANNGKKELTSYYISMMWKFIFFFMFALGAVVFSFAPLLMNDLFQAFGAEEYVLAAGFIIPNILATILEEPLGTADNIILGANRPWFKTVITLIFDLIGVFNLWFWLFFVEIQNYGIEVLVWFIPLHAFIPNLIRLIISWRYVDKNIAPVRLKEFAWQAFIAPIGPSLIIAGIAQLWYHFVFPPLEGLLGTVIAGVISLAFALLFCLLFLFFPLYTAFGGWDENTFKIFKEAVKISGPSKFLFTPLVWTSNLLGKTSPLHNRFKIPYEKAEIEAVELMKERHIKDELVKIINKREVAA